MTTAATLRSIDCADRPIRKKILIVEDNTLNMKLVDDLLEAHDYDTLRTDDGRQVLALAREHHPDLILMDIQLPHVSGLEVIKWLKQDDDLRMIPVIAVTAFARQGDEEKIRGERLRGLYSQADRDDELS